MLLVSIICTTTGPVFRIDFIPLDRHFLTQQCHVARVKMASRYTFIRSSVYISPQIVNKMKKYPFRIVYFVIWYYIIIHNHLERKLYYIFKFLISFITSYLIKSRLYGLVLSSIIAKIKIIDIYKIPVKDLRITYYIYIIQNTFENYFISFFPPNPS